MTSSNIQSTGVRFVAENFQGYLNSIKSATAATSAWGRQLVTDSTKATTATNKVSKATSALANNAKRDFGALAVGAKLGLGLATAGIIGFGVSSIKAASDLEESINAVNVTFGRSAKIIHDWGKDSATNVGLTTAAFNQLSTRLGAMLKNAGFSTDEVAQKTIELTTRAADMASVFNTDVTDALGAITAALRGEIDPIERYGVSMNAAAIEAKALADSGKASAAQLTLQEKAAARLALIFQQTAASAGDFANTSDGLANRQRILAATIGNVQAEFGKAFGPITQAALGAVLSIISDPGFTQGLKDFGNILAVIIDSFRTGFNIVVIPALKWIADYGYLVAAALVRIGIAFAFAHPLGAAVTGLGLILTLIGLIRADSSKLPPEFLQAKLALLGFVEDGINGLRTFGSWILKAISAPLQGVIELLNTIIRGLNSIPSSINLGPFGTVRNPFGGGSDIPEIPSIWNAIEDQNNSKFRFTAERAETEKALDKALQKTAKTINASAIPAIDDLGDAAGADAGGAGAKAKEATPYHERLAAALEDGIITLQENIEQELGLTAARAGQLEAEKFLQQELFASEERTFSMQKAISGLTSILASGERAFASFTRTMTQGALELQRAASSAIFGRPSREEAALQLQIAQLEQMSLGADLAGEGIRARSAEEIRRIEGEIDRLREEAANLGRTEPRPPSAPDNRNLTDAQRHREELAIFHAEQERERQIEAQRDAIEREIRAREDQIRNLQTSVDGITGPFDQLREHLSKQLQLMEAENRVQQLQLQLADHTLLSEQEQFLMQQELLRNVGDLSMAYRNQTSILGETVVPAFNQARDAANFLRDALYGAGVAVGGAQPRASGGSVSLGHPYWVGEQGRPELFVPRQSGSIVPQTMVSRMFGMNSIQPSNQQTISIGSITLPNVANAEQFVEEVDRVSERRLRFGGLGVPSP